nr:MAG TPA: hypothetical protein [Caudoviricetes sp.]
MDNLTSVLLSSISHKDLYHIPLSLETLYLDNPFDILTFFTLFTLSPQLKFANKS